MARTTKTRKLRGSRTYARGRGKSHNSNSGNKGGVGRAGSGKKGDAKKPSFWEKPFKKTAFGMIKSKSLEALNVSQVQQRVETLVATGKVKDKKVSLDLTKLGVEKLLGSGNISHPVSITVRFASKKAITKVEAAGGEVILPNTDAKVESKDSSSEE